jgi:hypothetical protein
MANEKDLTMDGQLFLSDSNPPEPPSYADTDIETLNSSEALWGEDFRYYLKRENLDENTIFERVLFKTKDPTSLPHTRKKCVKMCSAGPAKFCCGWKIQYRWLYVTGVLRVTTSAPVNIKDAVEDCLKQAGVVAAITAVVSGGTAAIAAAEAALKACLLSKLGNNLLTVSINLHHQRGDWE